MSMSGPVFADHVDFPAIVVLFPSTSVESNATRTS